MSLPKVIAQVVLTGAQIFGRAFADAYKQAAANAARQSASASGPQRGPANADGSTNVSDDLTFKTGLTLDEAANILNLKKEPLPTQEEVLARYETMFKQNDPEKGGSWYLQAKVFRARERFDLELAEALKVSNPAAGAEPPAGGDAGAGPKV
ncbi:hypothetical protein AMAG_17775 [Allomyces macrogynus ATCC 38327]|uniref:Mitochondrial import inner membrane translocase subunit TIM16 n=1 Tax=Allomyces macrogynus (strain ATCC 38327) TaxID=578462 RepID=A0A0L0RYG0_ALLM3|nr:hypothetical protein AMAG_17775 [Allomyces macrogynus ATCC 38327]|eukprot:KNE55388.1 hypothetical protein AMAG_17775 [Allomyces macrogynus ATCC 38327]